MQSSDIDQTLAKNELQLNQDKEVNRILSCFKLDPYSILELLPGCSSSDIKKQFRKKSLLIHPDKCLNINADLSFDILKKAESAFNSNEQEKQRIDDIYSAARKLVLKEEHINEQSLDFENKWKAKIKDILIEEELIQRLELKNKLKKENEEFQRKQQLAQLAKLKAQSKQTWEAQRDSRVQNWNNYLNKAKLKLKSKNKKTSKKLLI